MESAALKKRTRRLNIELYRLRGELGARKLNEEQLRLNEDLVRYYTGLPNFIILRSVYNLVEGHVRHTTMNSLSKFEEMLVTLVKTSPKLAAPGPSIQVRYIGADSVANSHKVAECDVRST